MFKNSNLVRIRNVETMSNNTNKEQLDYVFQQPGQIC